MKHCIGRKVNSMILTKEGGLFTSYINTFLKLKQQASGFPEYIQTNEEKDHYIEQYFLHEGILLEKDLIEKNPGLRSLSKLALNSFYGKFGQRTNLKKDKVCNRCCFIVQTFHRSQ